MHCLHLLTLLLSVVASNKFGAESRSAVEAAVVAKDASIDVTKLSDDALLLEFQRLISKELAQRAESDPAAAVSWYEQIQSRLTERHGLWPWMDNDDLVNQNPSAKTPPPSDKKVFMSGISSVTNKEAQQSLEVIINDETGYYHQETIRQITPRPKMAARVIQDDVMLDHVKFEEVARLAMKELDREQAQYKTLSEDHAALHSEMGNYLSTAAERGGMGWLSEDNLQALLRKKKL